MQTHLSGLLDEGAALLVCFAEHQNVRYAQGEALSLQESGEQLGQGTQQVCRALPSVQLHTNTR